MWASVLVAQGLGCSVTCCDLPGPGIEPILHGGRPIIGHWTTRSQTPTFRYLEELSSPARVENPVLIESEITQGVCFGVIWGQRALADSLVAWQRVQLLMAPDVINTVLELTTSPCSASRFAHGKE